MRCLQHMGLPCPDYFSFKVLRPIDVGTTVTAIKFGSLHRGVVLDYNVDRCSYYIEFDKKELGLEFCLDYEVATYRVPTLMYGTDSVTLEGTDTAVAAARNQPRGELENGKSYASIGKVTPEYRKGTTAFTNGVVEHFIGNGHIGAKGNLARFDTSERDGE